MYNGKNDSKNYKEKLSQEGNELCVFVCGVKNLLRIFFIPR